MESSNTKGNIEISFAGGEIRISRTGKVLLNGTISPLDGSSVQVDKTGSGLVISFSRPVTFQFRMQESWFGYGEMLNQRIKLNEIMLPLDRFLTYDNGPSGQSSILAPVFYSSSGVLMEIPTLDRIGINQPPTGYPRYTWSFGDEKGPFEHRPFDDDGSGDGEITAVVHPGEIRIQVSNSLSQTVKSYLTALPHPGSFPPERLFELPTWTTWARYKIDVSQSVVLQFADEIQSHEYPYGVMEIDDRWQTRYGDIEFDPTRFPDPHRMIEELHTRGFKVTCWVIPFLDPKSKAGMDGAQLDYLIKDQSGNPYQVPWWQGRGYLLDVSNPEALDWFKTRLIQLQNEIGLDGYKFDAGEACFLPADAVSREVMPGNEYTQRYIDFIGKNFSLTEVRSGWNNQNAPIFFRQWDKWSTWGADNGLKSVLTGILALGIVGYPFVLPDMVGGNSYDQVPDSELMIRWAELNALLPAMQFSLAPWDFGEECSRICKKYAQLHKTFASEFISLAREAASTGLPIIRPIWWNIPEDENALNCKDEFLLGEKYLVAPILKRGARARTVYLPAGDWEDFWTRERLQGERYSEVDAALDQLPVFCKIK